MGLRISELASHAAVPVSTVRYYERIGLLRSPERLDNGYRMYDESVAEHLAFIGRAKRMGIPLAQVSELIELWSDGGCRPMQEQIRKFLRGRVDEVRAQRHELAAFARQLDGLLGRIDGTSTEDRLCELDCACVHLDEADPLAGCERFSAVARETDMRAQPVRPVGVTPVALVVPAEGRVQIEPPRTQSGLLVRSEARPLSALVVK